jgi:hypothetical protein
MQNAECRIENEDKKNEIVPLNVFVAFLNGTILGRKLITYIS